jgi:hypothetical protein
MWTNTAPIVCENDASGVENAHDPGWDGRDGLGDGEAGGVAHRQQAGRAHRSHCGLQ